MSPCHNEWTHTPSRRQSGQVCVLLWVFFSSYDDTLVGQLGTMTVLVTFYPCIPFLCDWFRNNRAIKHMCFCYFHDIHVVHSFYCYLKSSADVHFENSGICYLFTKTKRMWIFMCHCTVLGYMQITKPDNTHTVCAQIK